MQEREKIAFNALSKYIWKSFKLDFECHIKSLDAANLVMDLTRSYTYQQNKID